MPHANKRSRRGRTRRGSRRIALAIVGVVLVLGGGLVTYRSITSPGAEERVSLALELQSQGNLSGAVIELKRALNAAPADIRARWLLANVYLALGDGAAAQDELEEAQALGFSDPALTNAMLRALLLQRKYGEVLGSVALDTGEGEHAVTRLILQGKAQIGLGLEDSAADSFSRALKLRPDNIEARRGLALVAFDKQDLDESTRQLDVSLQAAPEDSRSWLLKGEIELKRTRFEAAQRAFERAVEISGDNPAARLGLARALLGQGKPDEAQTHVEIVGQVYPRNPYVNYLRAVAARQRNDLEASKAALEAVFQVAPQHPASLLLMGSIHYMQRDLEQASDVLARFLETAPGHVAGSKLLASVYLQRGDLPAAAVTLHRALNQSPRDAQLLAMLGSATIRAGRFDEGMAYLEKAAALSPDAAAIQTQLALGFMARGATRQGILALGSAGEAEPGFIWDDFLLTVVHLQQRNFDSALSSALTLSRSQPDNALSHNLIGVAYEGRGDPLNARKSYEKALSIQPDYSTAALNLARMDLWGGETEAARVRYEAILERRNDHPKALAALAAIAAGQGRTQEGVRLLERARKSDPTALEPHLVLADYYLTQGMHWEALAITEDAYKLSPEPPRVLLALGRAQLGVGHVSDALATFLDLTQRYPQASIAHYYLALAQARGGDIAKPRASLHKALDLEGGDLAAQFALGRLELGSGNLADATRSARRLQSKHPESPVGYLLHGEILMARGKAVEAASAFEKAFQRSGTNTLLTQVYAAQIAAGRQENADAALEQWLSAHPDDVAVRVVLANSRLLQKDYEGAIGEYERVLGRDPRHVLALNNLAWLYDRRGDARALRFAARAHEAAPRDPDVLDTYGWLLVQSGNAKRGVALLRRAVGEAPERANFRYHLASGLVRSGDVAGARKQLEKALEGTPVFTERGAAQALLERLR